MNHDGPLSPPLSSEQGQSTTQGTFPGKRPLLVFTILVVLTLVVALGVEAALSAPSPTDLGILALVLCGFALLSLAVGHAGYRFSWLKRSPRILWTVFGGYALVSVLTLLGVIVAALLMFISVTDVKLVAVLLLFGLGVAISFGYLIATSLSADATRLVTAADQVAEGKLDVFVEPQGHDEMAVLARAFNGMTGALADATERHRNAERARLDLLAWAGHDLRTPLTSVTVIVEALADGLVTDPETATRYLQTAKRDLRVLTMLIDDLTLLAQFDAGGLQLAKSQNSLSNLLDELGESFSLRSKQKHVRYTEEISPTLEPFSFDAFQMRRALTNLLDNAVRHVPEGGEVRLSARSRGEEILIEVQNDGSPIDPDDLPHLFERFYRSSGSSGGPTGRAGLGLAIAKAIIEAHQGTIAVRSELGQGTRFVVTLPNG